MINSDIRFDEILKKMKSTKVSPNIEPKYQCEKCKDTETILYLKNGIEYGRDCECKEVKMSIRIMANSGICEEDLKKTFNDFETFNEKKLIEAKQKAARYIKQFKEIRTERNNSFLLCGLSGRGKTTLGMIIANNLLSQLISVRYMSYRDEIMRLKQVVTDEINYNDRINRLKNAKVLFIDDLFKGKITESDINIMYEIINYRYLNRLPMIISTELIPSKLLDIDEAVGGRILEMCKGNAVVFDNDTQNYRLRGFEI